MTVVDPVTTDLSTLPSDELWVLHALLYEAACRADGPVLFITQTPGQVDHARRFFAACASHRDIHVITWWAIVDMLCPEQDVPEAADEAIGEAPVSSL